MRFKSLALAGAFALLAMPTTMSAQTPPVAQAPTDAQARMDQEFQEGLAAATSQQWQVAVQHFQNAAHAFPDRNPDWGIPNSDSLFNDPTECCYLGGRLLEPFSDHRRTLPEEYSSRPETWFNLALAESHVGGHELRAIAGFEAYLLLSPQAQNQAEIAAAIQQLESAYEERLSSLLDRVFGGFPRGIGQTCGHLNAMNAPSACYELGIAVGARVYLGQRRLAQAFLDHVQLDEEAFPHQLLRTQDAYASDDAAWADWLSFPGNSSIASSPLRQASAREHYLLEAGNWAAVWGARDYAHDRQPNWQILCSARWFHDDAAERSMAVAIRDAQGINNLSVSVLMELGYGDYARTVAARIDPSLTQRDLRIQLDQVPPSFDPQALAAAYRNHSTAAIANSGAYYSLRPCESTLDPYSVLWWGPAKLALLQSIANGDFSGADGTRIAQLYARYLVSQNTTLAESARRTNWHTGLEDLARTYRWVHGPFSHRS